MYSAKTTVTTQPTFVARGSSESQGFHGLFAVSMSLLFVSPTVLARVSEDQRGHRSLLEVRESPHGETTALPDSGAAGIARGLSDSYYSYHSYCSSCSSDSYDRYKRAEPATGPAPASATGRPAATASGCAAAPFRLGQLCLRSLARLRAPGIWGDLSRGLLFFNDAHPQWRESG